VLDGDHPGPAAQRQMEAVAAGRRRRESTRYPVAPDLAGPHHRAPHLADPRARPPEQPDRGAELGLRHDRRGHGAPARHPTRQLSAAERADAVHLDARPEHRVADRRHDHHRAGLRRAGGRLAPDHVHPDARLLHHPVRGTRPRHARDPRQPLDRSHLRTARPAGVLPVMSVSTLAVPRPRRLSWIATGGWSLRVGLVGFALIAVLALLAPWIAPYDPTALGLAEGLQPPNRSHWFGT